MNVFVLCTGRCGSVSIIKACEFMENYTCGHEERAGFIGEERLAYPENHIEADNRLSWYFGRLHFKYGNEAFYVHLTRDINATAKSYAKRHTVGIMHAFADGLLRKKTLSENATEPLPLATEICETADANIRHFLSDKTNKCVIRLEHIKEDFAVFWKAIDAQGDFDSALESFNNPHNTSKDFMETYRKMKKSRFRRAVKEKIKSFLRIFSR